MDEFFGSTQNPQLNAAPGREPWIASVDLSTVEHIGSQALRLKRLVSNETLSVADGPGWRAIFDGILYNGQELAERLSPKERSASSAHLLGSAHRRWGNDFLNRIEGIFAFLIIDELHNRFLAIRDRLGFQPLFYAVIGETFLFSDSIIELHHDPQVPSSLNRPALADFLSRRAPDDGETFFTEIRRIVPAEKLEINLSSRQHSFTSYWEPSPPGTPDDSMTVDDLEQFDCLLEQAIRRSLKFGKSGIFLSGGLDSVSVGAVAADLSAREGWPSPLALSVAFPDPEAGEEPVQRAVASGLGLSQVMLPFSEGVGAEGLFWSNMKLNRMLAAPIDNPWRSVYLRLMHQAKEKDIRVIMTGGGGDDWLTVNQDYMADLLGNLDLANSYRFARSSLNSYRLPRLAMLRFLFWNSGMRPLLTRKLRQLGQFLAPEWLHNLRYKKFMRGKQTPEWIAEDPQLRQELYRRSEKNILRYMERPKPEGPYGFYKFSGVSYSFACLLYSLSQEEDFAIGRQLGMRLMHPYWDDRLVQFMCKVPPRLLLRGGREKGLVRQSVALRFPNLGFERQKKVLASSFFVSRVHQEGPAAWQRIGGASALTGLGIVSISTIEDLMQESLSSDSIATSWRAWEVLNLESWVRAHM